MAAIDPLIENLKTTTFGGRRFTRRQLAQVQDLVATFPALSRRELAQTLCEQLNWHTPAGQYRIKAALQLLEDLAGFGILTLPPKRHPDVPRPRKPVPHTPRSDPQPQITGPLAALTPLRLLPVASAEQIALCKEFIDRYHYLGYRQPVGPHLRYLLYDRQQRPLGAMLFQQGTLTLACRDRWIGWEPDQYRHHLHRVVSQARFLLLPWVRVEHLASHALALAVRQLPSDWHRQYRYQPVLIETFVDPQRFVGTCYRAANWLAIGQTQGRTDHPPKDVYLYPLTKDCRQILCAGPPKSQRRSAPPQTAVEVTPDAAFVQTWRELIDALSSLASQHDRQWQQRRRVLDTLLVMLFVFRLVFAPRRLGYTATLAELWDHCRHLEVPLPQPHPVSAAAITRARRKVDPQVFRQFHAAILRRCPQSPDHLWRGHRVFAIDGSKLTLPHPLIEEGYPLPHPQSHYPQGLLSCLYRLHSRLPVDFDLHAHGNERQAALAHLKALSGSDLVVYDRGYYCFELLAAHHDRQLPAVFRLQSNSGTPIAAFLASPLTDTCVTIEPGPGTLRKLAARYPDTVFQPLSLRLVKYTHASTSYLLGTTLLDARRYPIAALSDLYHSRWAVEEGFKISKQFLEVEQFHGRSERLVRQELWAHFNLIAMTRTFTNRDAALCAAAQESPDQPVPQANFKHSLHTLARHLEALMLSHSQFLHSTLATIAEYVGVGRQRPRPDRSVPRESQQPASKWSRRKSKKTQTQA